VNHEAAPILLEGPANISGCLEFLGGLCRIVIYSVNGRRSGAVVKLFIRIMCSIFPVVAHIDKVQFDNAKIRALLFGQEPIAESIFCIQVLVCWVFKR